VSKTWLILKREFLTLVKGKGFIIMTLLFPLIGFGAIGIYELAQITNQADSTEIQRIGYVDEFGGFDHHPDDSERVSLVPYHTRDEATGALLADDIDEYFVIPTGYLQQGTVTRFHMEKELEMPGDTYRVIQAFLQDNLLQGQTSPEIAERVKNPLGVRSIRIDDTGEVATDQGGFASFIVPMVFGFLLIMAIGSSSGTLLQGLGEEKQNRIMEILLSSVSTKQLLIGKVLGLGGGGLVQITVWLAAISLLVPLASSAIGGLFTSVIVPENMILLGIVYFILGYLLFSVLSAGIGAVAANPKDTPQITVLLMLTAILPFYVALFFLRDNPDHVIGTVMTLFPLTAPMSVFIRLGMSEIATWELVVSILILILSIIGSLLLAAKTFRIFLLMYGKTPRLTEIRRILRQESPKRT